MFTYECVLAAALLTAPAEPDAPPPPAALVAALHPALMQAAVDVEVVDPREDALLQGQSRDPAGDFRQLAARYRDLRAAPLVAECDRLPDRRTIADFLACNRTYRRELETRLTVDQVHAEALRIGIAETDQLHFVWNLVRDARCEYYYVTVRRQALMQLRDLIGPDAYYRAQLPPHIPVWHFPSLR
jgi:hypothetical protein